jgi:hypothetical protein
MTQESLNLEGMFMPPKLYVNCNDYEMQGMIIRNNQRFNNPCQSLRRIFDSLSRETGFIPHRLGIQSHLDVRFVQYFVAQGSLVYIYKALYYWSIHRLT